MTSLLCQRTKCARVLLAFVFLSGVVAVGCGKKATSGEISQVTPALADDAKTPPAMTSKERLRVRDMVPTGGGNNPHAGMSGAPGGEMSGAATGSDFTYETPAGWQDLPGTPMRAINFKVGEASECYLTVLGGSGGGLASNLNRWRKQMGQPELSEADVAALPKKPLLGNAATLITIDGAFSGMGGAEAKPGYRMVGLVYVSDSQSVFMKLVGPQAEVEKETANFDAFCASLVKGGGAPHAAVAAPAAAPAPAASPAPAMPAAAAGDASSPGFKYTAPAGWQEQPSSPMRAVNFKLGAESECYVSVLGGSAGGAASNVNRWRKQMGQPDLSDAELAALTKKPLLGGEATQVTIDGAFAGMGGGEGKPNYRMLGVVLMTPERSVFVKAVGPQAEIEKETANFDAFIASLSDSGAAAPAAPAAATPAPVAPVTAPAASVAAPPMAAAHPGAAAGGLDASKIQWVAPPSWQKGPEKMMRLVTYNVGKSECYITVLDGPAGGVEANLNRWRGQMGQADLTADDIAKLPKLTIMGKEASLLQATGDYTTMNGEQLHDQMLVGALCVLDNGLLTVKMTGPAAEVTAELENFKSFCTSLSSN